ncbi:uncharacterized protein [Diadema setosum]|uniref:uncharacterized protein n=1 Tax=Diadema setosum TaxID=31175 RepID=UPI003B3B5729
MDLASYACYSLVILLGCLSAVHSYVMPIAGRTRPPQSCPANNDLTYRRCLSPCHSFTCEDVRNEPPSGSWPCVRICVSGWACPRGHALLDGYSDVCVERNVCARRETSCVYQNEVMQVNTSILDGDLTCRCFADGVVRCRNPFPTA